MRLRFNILRYHYVLSKHSVLRLPEDIQTAACNENIRLDDVVYGGWSDGSWYVVPMSYSLRLNAYTLAPATQVLVSIQYSAFKLDLSDTLRFPSLVFGRKRILQKNTLPRTIRHSPIALGKTRPLHPHSQLPRVLVMSLVNRQLRAFHQ